MDNIIGNNALRTEKAMKKNPEPHMNGKYLVTEDFTECIPMEEGLKEIEEIKQILLYQLKSMKTL